MLSHKLCPALRTQQDIGTVRCRELSDKVDTRWSTLKDSPTADEAPSFGITGGINNTAGCVARRSIYRALRQRQGSYNIGGLHADRSWYTGRAWMDNHGGAHEGDGQRPSLSHLLSSSSLQRRWQRSVPPAATGYDSLPTGATLIGCLDPQDTAYNRTTCLDGRGNAS